MRRLLILTAVLLTMPTATAQAGLFPGDPIDGPSADIQRLGDVDLARDGTGALTYVKRVDGLDQIFVARFANGAFGAGERVDTGLPGPSSQPVVAAADTERLVVVFVNGGVVYGVVRPAGAGYAAPVPLALGSDPSVDLSINGTAYTSFTSGGDVRIARLDRRSNTWGLLEQPADIDPSRAAGVGTARSRVAIAADGVGVVTWGEGGHVYARKMFGAALSSAPQDLTPDVFEERATSTSDAPDVDAEDDSSFAWVVFRQRFPDGSTRILARRQRGTIFDAPVAVEVPDGEPVLEPDIDINGRGVGLATTVGAASGQPMVDGVFERDAFGVPARIFGLSAIPALVAPAMSENNDGLVASVLTNPGEPSFVRVLTYDDRKPGKETTISRPELGAVDPARGFDAAVDRASGGVIAWIQGAEDERRLVAGYLDREPGFFAGFTSQKCCQPALARLSWQPSFGLWGPQRYEVRIDGQLVAATTATNVTLTTPISGATHRWQVTAIDQRGQTRRSRTRLLRIDDLAPKLSVSYKRAKRVVTISARGADQGGAGRRSSGIASVVVSWGDRSAGARGVARVKARHRYPGPGTYPLLITATDESGNVATYRRGVRVG